jgi:DNA relaxase NicK
VQLESITGAGARLDQGAEAPPPDGNTGVDFTNEAEGVEFAGAEPAIEDLVDWVAFTLPTLPGRPSGAVDMALWGDLLGDLEWEELPNGHKLGYAGCRVAAAGGIKLYYSGLSAADDMGSHVEISGSGCRFLEVSGVVKDWSVWASLALGYGARASRVDFCRDDRAQHGKGLLDLAYLDRLALDWANKRSKQLVCKFGTFEAKAPLDARTGQRKGHSLIFGNRSSETYIRMYDKSLEVCKKIKGARRVEFLKQYGHHVRVEIEYKGRRAKAAFQMLADEGLSSLGGLIYACLDFKSRPVEAGENATRVPRLAVWETFCGAQSKVRLAISVVVKKLHEQVNFLSTQWGPTMAAVVKAHGGDASMLVAVAKAAMDRLKPRHLKLIEGERARWAPPVSIISQWEADQAARHEAIGAKIDARKEAGGQAAAPQSSSVYKRGGQRAG